MAATLMQRLADLRRASDSAAGLTRLYLSPAHRAAMGLVAGWMDEAGLAPNMDAVGNLVGRAGGGGKTLLLGSHIDTVRDAGAYDGNFGVLAALEALRRLRAAGEALPYGVEIIAFGDEEGVRFPSALAGSRAVAGSFDPLVLTGEDAQGVTMAAALRAFGGDPDAIAAIARHPDDIAAYVELHIEQGPVLEANDLPVGIVTAINGASRFAVTVTGEAGHAGTVPMPMRHDALTAAAEMILAVEAVARGGPALVGTVGALSLHPGAPNSVPGQVRFSIDLRAPADEVRQRGADAITAACRRIATARGVNIAFTRTHDAPATLCAPWLRDQLARAAAVQGIAPFHLPSGAGHDAMAMAALCPVGMLFVRCKGGISHTPEESITEADAETAVAVLLQFLKDFIPP